MDQQPVAPAPPPSPPEPAAPVGSEGKAVQPHSHKKIILIVLALLVLIVATASGVYLWSQHQKELATQRAAEAARIKAEKAAAALKQGTIKEIEQSLTAGFKQESDEDTRLIYNDTDSLQREATQAITTGTNNATDL